MNHYVHIQYFGPVGFTYTEIIPVLRPMQIRPNIGSSLFEKGKGRPYCSQKHASILLLRLIISKNVKPKSSKLYPDPCKHGSNTILKVLLSKAAVQQILQFQRITNRIRLGIKRTMEKPKLLRAYHISRQPNPP